MFCSTYGLLFDIHLNFFLSICAGDYVGFIYDDFEPNINSFSNF